MIQAYRKAGVPLVALECADPASVLESINKGIVNGTTPPLLVWDCIRGIQAVNAEAQDLAGTLNDGGEPAIVTGNPVEALRKLMLLPEKAVCVMFGLGPMLTEPQSGIAIQQALWNLRDRLKSEGACVVLTVPLGYKLPPVLTNDIITQVVPLPDSQEISGICKQLLDDAKLSEIKPEVLSASVSALSGLSGFAAEQAFALSLSKQGVDTVGMWERKRRMIEQTRGLSVYRGSDTFSDLGGLDNAKSLFRLIIKGKRPYRLVVWIDEAEKMFAGSSSDSSGVSQGFLGVTLSEMEDNGYTGAVLYGHPGTGKSAIAKATAGEMGCICLRFDMGGMKASLVGESEQYIRAAWQIIKAVAGQGGALVLATCNSMDNMPAEFLARFRFGTMFFDLPTQEEQATIWNLWRKRYGIPEEYKLPDCDGWVGREIATCCDLADRLSCTLEDASKYVVPVCKSSAEVIESRRKRASGKYLSASYPGVYKYEQRAPVGRKMEV